MASVGFLIFPDFQLLDAAGPISAFEVAGRMGDPYRLKVMANWPGLVASTSGAKLQAEALSPVDTLIVAGGAGVRGPATCAQTLAYIKGHARRGKRLASVCSGSAILAATGLLDGRRATTHWGRSRQFPRIFPKVRWELDRIYVRDGDIWTSAGITAGIDLALAMIADDRGEPVAMRTAQELVVYRRRPGGQSQFSALLEMERPDGRFGPLLGWMRERLNAPLTVEVLAEKAGMSPRNFARTFTAETGMTPAKAVERLRLEAARERIEAGPEPIDTVAQTTGFGDPERMRRAFVRAFGQPPQALRRAARKSGTT